MWADYNDISAKCPQCVAVHFKNGRLALPDETCVRVVDGNIDDYLGNVNNFGKAVSQFQLPPDEVFEVRRSDSSRRWASGAGFFPAIDALAPLRSSSSRPARAACPPPYRCWRRELGSSEAALWVAGFSRR